MLCKQCFYAYTHGMNNCPALVPGDNNPATLKREQERRQLVCEETRENDRNDRRVYNKVQLNK